MYAYIDKSTQVGDWFKIYLEIFKEFNNKIDVAEKVIENE